MTTTIKNAKDKGVLAGHEAELIQKMTAITPDDYNEFVFESGLRFARNWCRRDQWAVTMITYRQEFWKWWRNEFEAADREFIRTWGYNGFESDSHRARLQQIWKTEHSLNNVKSFPSLDATYTEMLNELLKEKEVANG